MTGQYADGELLSPVWRPGMCDPFFGLPYKANNSHRGYLTCRRATHVAMQIPLPDGMAR